MQPQFEKGFRTHYYSQHSCIYCTHTHTHTDTDTQTHTHTSTQTHTHTHEYCSTFSVSDSKWFKKKINLEEKRREEVDVGKSGRKENKVIKILLSAGGTLCCTATRRYGNTTVSDQMSSYDTQGT